MVAVPVSEDLGAQVDCRLSTVEAGIDTAREI